MSDKRDERLSGLLIQQGLVTGEEVERARLHPQTRQDGLGGGLVALGLLSEQALLDFLARQFHTEQVALEGAALEQELAHRMTFALCEKHDAVPVEVVGRTLVLAMADPGDFHALDELRFRVGMNVRPVVAGRGAIRRALRRLFPDRMAARDLEEDPVAHEARSGNLAPVPREGPDAEGELRRRYEAALAAARAGDRGLDHPALGLTPEDQMVIRLCHELLYTAVAEELTHVRLELLAEGTRVAFRRRDSWAEETEVPQALQLRILWHLKGLCELPMGPLRRPAHAPTPLQLGAGRVRWVRVFFVPTTAGLVVLISPVPADLDFRIGGLDPAGTPEAQPWWEAFRAGKHAQCEGRYSQAESALREGVAEAENRGAAGRLALADTLVCLGEVIDASGRPADARPIFERAVSLVKAELGPDSPLLVAGLTGLADAHLRLGRTDDAIAVFRQALLKAELAFGPLDLEVVWLMDRIRWICEDHGNVEEAESYAGEVRRVLAELAGVERRNVRVQ